ncbi:MAG: CinA family nicotinamide mononucleotide deamidase-related protein [Planctomycetota bacterium]|nr:CinA family nicotinamide mononucleotide deamidase-related protein [Planctomycetota bacterium]
MSKITSTAAILAIGSELLTGRTVDTNSAYIGSQLELLGFTVPLAVTCDDDAPAIAEQVRNLLGEHDILITCGGLGPTFDDVTRIAAADALGVRLVRSEAARASTLRYFERTGRQPTDSNESQAYIPQGTEALDNSIGSAAGFHFERDGHHLFCLPGIPSEMKQMFTSTVRPVLESMLDSETHVRRLEVFGTSESRISALITNLDVPTGVRTAINASFGIKVCRFYTTNRNLFSTVDSLADKLAASLGETVISTDGRSLVEVVARQLKELSLTAGTCESCTAGLVGKMLTDLPGSSDYFSGSLVTYTNELKANIGVSHASLIKHGAVSEHVALQMASSARSKLGVDVAVSTTGIAGPTGGSSDKPVGLVYVGYSGPDGGTFEKHIWGGNRHFNRMASTNAALDLIRRRLRLEKKP